MTANILGVLLAAAALTAAGPAPGAERLKTSHLKFEFVGLSTKAVKGLVENADKTALKISADVGYRPARPIKVIITNSPAAFARAQPEGVTLPQWATGVAYPKLNRVVLKNALEIEKTFKHELSHIYLYQAVGLRWLPKFFVEGFAMFQAGEWSFSRTSSLMKAALARKFLSLDALTHSFPAHKLEASLAYAISGEFISYLMGRGGRYAFNGLIAKLRAGRPFKPALEDVYRTSFRKLDEDFRKDLTVRYSWIPVCTGSMVLWLAIAGIFILAYFRKRQTIKEKLRRWEAEETDQDWRARQRQLEEDALRREDDLSRQEEDEWPPPPTYH